MPASERSVRLTDVYRRRLVALRDRAGQLVRREWSRVTLDDFDRSHTAWLGRAAAALEAAQLAGVNLTTAYVAAYVASEAGTPPTPPEPVTESVGVAQDGRPVLIALAPTLITVKTALKAGSLPAESLEQGANRAVRIAQTAAMAAPRFALTAAMGSDFRIVGWRRVTFGGCGACLAEASNVIRTVREPLKVHDHCRCTAEPVVADVADRVTRPSGRELFDAMPTDQQNQTLGPKAAELVRTGRVAFEELIGNSPMVVGPDQLTQAPIGALGSTIAAPASQE